MWAVPLSRRKAAWKSHSPCETPLSARLVVFSLAEEGEQLAVFGGSLVCGQRVLLQTRCRLTASPAGGLGGGSSCGRGRAEVELKMGWFEAERGAVEEVVVPLCLEALDVEASQGKLPLQLRLLMARGSAGPGAAHLLPEQTPDQVLESLLGCLERDRGVPFYKSCSRRWLLESAEGLPLRLKFPVVLRFHARELKLRTGKSRRLRGLLQGLPLRPTVRLNADFGERGSPWRAVTPALGDEASARRPTSASTLADETEGGREAFKSDETPPQPKAEEESRRDVVVALLFDSEAEREIFHCGIERALCSLET